MESYWSVNSNDHSKEYARFALKLVFDNLKAYLDKDSSVNHFMLKAANLAGKAINITQTTAGHAMCYKLTSMYGIAHGHAAALCVRKLLPYMVHNTDKCIDKRGREYLDKTFVELAKAMGCISNDEMCMMFSNVFNDMGLSIPKPSGDDISRLANSVNPVRLKNNPVELTLPVIESLYREILQ